MDKAGLASGAVTAETVALKTAAWPEPRRQLEPIFLVPMVQLISPIEAMQYKGEVDCHCQNSERSEHWIPFEQNSFFALLCSCFEVATLARVAP